MATREPMLDMFLFETAEMIEQVQQLMIESEKNKEINSSAINEIFRAMHTIKGSSGMMMYDNISHLAHMIEDMFYFIRENKPKKVDYSSLADLVLEGSDLIKAETDKIDAGQEANTDFSDFIEKVKLYVEELRRENGLEVSTSSGSSAVKVENSPKFYITNDNDGKPIYYFYAVIYFEEKCEMENIRSFTILHKLKEIADVVRYEPEDILEGDQSIETIRQNGFKMYFKTEKMQQEIYEFLQETIFLEKLELQAFQDEKTLLGQFEIPTVQELIPNLGKAQEEPEKLTELESVSKPNHKSTLISVDVSKLDSLMDLVGELVISESMVTNNPELKGLVLDDFFKAVRQHRKRISDLQDVVMPIRMVSLAPTLAGFSGSH